MHGPSVVSFDITFRCNLSCVMCHTWSRGVHSTAADELSRDEIVRIARRLKETHGVELFRFMGGEPLTRPDLPDILLEVSSFATTRMTTNGLLLTATNSRRLIESGLGALSVSLDGPRANSDALRGPGAYERAIAGVETLLRVRSELDSQLPVTIGTVVTKLNLHRLDEAVAFAQERGLEWHLWPMTHLQPAAAQTEWNGVACGFEHPDTDRAAELVLSDDELALFWRSYYALARRLGKPGSRKSLQGWIGPLKQLALHPVFTPVLFRRCQRLRQHLIVDPFGNVLPCEYLRSVPLGSVRDAGEEVWDTPTRRALQRAADDRSLPVCHECHRLGLYRRHC